MSGVDCQHITSTSQGSQGINLREEDLPESLKHVIFVKESQLEIGRRIGSGSYGNVRRGRLCGKDVAVKEFKAHSSVHQLSDLLGDNEQTESCPRTEKMKKRFIKTLESEVKLLLSIFHPSILQFHGICLDPPVIVTEYCCHGSLFDCLR